MDDWQCTDGAPITEIQWWGSYLTQFGWYNWHGGADPVPTDAITEFRILIYSDVAAVEGSKGVRPQPSHPGELITSYTIPFADLNETLFGQDASGKDVYQYNAVLDTPFAQESGTTYWLGIVAVLNDADEEITDGEEHHWWRHEPETIWGWHTAVQPVNNDASVTLYGYDFETDEYRNFWVNGFGHHHGWWHGYPPFDMMDGEGDGWWPWGWHNRHRKSQDMAFELITEDNTGGGDLTGGFTSNIFSLSSVGGLGDVGPLGGPVPEPATISMMLLGGLGVVGGAIRKIRP
jgi:hypothetical protein